VAKRTNQPMPLTRNEPRSSRP